MNLHSDKTVHRNMDVSNMNCTFLHLGNKKNVQVSKTVSRSSKKTDSA